MDPSRLTNWPDIQSFVSKTHRDTYEYISPLNANFYGRSVLVTGASKGIGKAIAISFAQAGISRIAVLARSSLSEVENELYAAAAEAGRVKPQVLCLQADVTSESEVNVAAAEVTRAFGGSLDILVNNAGVTERGLPLLDSDPVEFWRTWEVNIKGLYLISRAFIPLISNSTTRAIVNLTSSTAHQIIPGSTGYASGKFAVMRFTEFLAADYANQGFTVFSIYPGAVATDMVTKLPKEMAKLFVMKPVLASDTIVWLLKEKREWLNGRFINSLWDMKELDLVKDDIMKRDLLKFRMVI